MDRDEILKAVQEEEHKDGEYENTIGKKSAMMAAAIGIFTVLVMFYVEYLVFHRLDFGKPALICIMSSISDLYDGIKAKKKSKIIIGIIAALLFVLCIIFYIGALLK